MSTRSHRGLYLASSSAPGMPTLAGLAAARVRVRLSEPRNCDPFRVDAVVNYVG